MHLVTNTVDPTQVHDRGDHYAIEDVPFVRAIELNDGYVPRSNLEATAADWQGDPATLNHVRNASGEPIAANRKPGLHIGQVDDPYVDGDTVKAGTLRIDKSRLTELGPEAREIRTALENGDPIEVSSQYASESLPPGEYDGQYRSNAVQIVETDSVAILPNKTGVCSVEDGCGINPQMAANADVSPPLTDDPVSPASGPGEDGGNPESTMDANASADGVEYQGTADGELDESAIPDDDFESHYVFDGDTKTASSFPLVDADGDLRRGNVESAFNLRGHASDTDALLDVLESVNDAFDDPPIDPEDLEDAMTANAGLVSNLRSFLGLDDSTDTETGGAESPADTDESPMGELENESMIEELAANTAFDRENLVKWDGTDCLANLHQKHVANADGGEAEDGEEEQTANAGGEPEVREITEGELEELVANRVDERFEERQAEAAKRDLADDIVANSNEYDDTDAVLADYPTEAALRTKRDQVGGGQAAMPGSGGQPTANAEDASDYPSPIASERAKELEADD